VFATHGSVEYIFALQELPSLKKLHPDCSGPQIVNHYFQAIEVYQSRRRRYLREYRGVSQTVRELQSLGIMIVAISDAHRYQVLSRLRQLRLIDLMDGVCCLDDPAGPSVDELNQIRRFDPSRYDFKVELEFILPTGLRKPSPAVLDWLLAQLGIEHHEAVYVGDSLDKDILMAREAGVLDCWAAYGNVWSPLNMATLFHVTHWPERVVERSFKAKPEEFDIQPSCVLDSFGDLIGVVTERTIHYQKVVPSKPQDPSSVEFELAPEAITDGKY